MEAPATDTPARGRPRDPERDAAIFDAALSLVAEVGYDRMSIDAVAARAGVSKPTIYRRCPEGKAQLVVQAVLARHDEKPPMPDTGSLRGDLLAMVTRICTGISEDSKLAVGLTTQLRSSDELCAIFREHVVAAERARWALLLARAAERGELRGRPSELFVDVGPALIHTRMLITEPLDDAFATELVDGVLLPILTNPDTRRNPTP
jgi:AcrR family transcriptional regulator